MHDHISRIKTNSIFFILLAAINPFVGLYYLGLRFKKAIFFIFIFSIFFKLLLSKYFISIINFETLNDLYWDIIINLVIYFSTIFLGLLYKEIFIVNRTFKPLNLVFLCIFAIIFNGSLSILFQKFEWQVFKNFKVPSSSMEPTIIDGDRVRANLYWYQMNEAKRGDIVIYDHPTIQGVQFVKRIVAVSGDKIRITNDRVEINGELLPTSLYSSKGYTVGEKRVEKQVFKENIGEIEHYILLSPPEWIKFELSNWPANGIAYEVPENSVFVLGDNRDDSIDSRNHGPVQIDKIKGKAIKINFSYSSSEGFRLSRLWMDII